MLATLIDAPFDGRDWVFETKWDGFRLVAKIEKGSLTLYSRSGLSVSDSPCWKYGLPPPSTTGCM